MAKKDVKLEGPLTTPYGEQGGLGGTDPHGVQPAKSVPDPLGYVKAGSSK